MTGMYNNVYDIMEYNLWLRIFGIIIYQNKNLCETRRGDQAAFCVVSLVILLLQQKNNNTTKSQ